MTARLSEDDLIATYFAPLAGPAGLGLCDDAACVTPTPGSDLVISADALVAGVHFFADDPPAAIARKSLRVNLSDLAAKGAEPIGYLLTLALPAGWDAEWLAAFAQGLKADGDLFACPLLGGDTVKTPGPLTLSVTVLGEVPRGRMVPRTGVRPADHLYVTGTIGDAALGLWLRTDGANGGAVTRGLDLAGRRFLADRYLLPLPRLALGQAMRAHAHAGMDVSDGLIGDITKMLRVSGVGATIEVARVPFSTAAKALLDASPGLLEVALTGGDDYEVLAAVPSNAAPAFEAAAKKAGVPVQRIGTADDANNSRPAFRNADGSILDFARGSFSHF